MSFRLILSPFFINLPRPPFRNVYIIMLKMKFYKQVFIMLF